MESLKKLILLNPPKIIESKMKRGLQFNKTTHFIVVLRKLSVLRKNSGTYYNDKN